MSKIGTISVIGLGKIGLPTALSLACMGGFYVQGCDSDQAVVDAINDGSVTTYEPGVMKMLKRCNENAMLTATTNVRFAVANTQATFIIVSTPAGASGEFSIANVINVAREIAHVIKHKDEYHLVNLVSTVMPGAHREIIALIENISGKTCGDGWGFTYSPEFVALGSVVQGWINPDLVLIGYYYSTVAARKLASIYARLCPGKQAVVVPIIDAEIAKLFINTYLVIKIASANMIGDVCERIPGANADNVTSVAGMDSRIGGKYLKTGGPAGGPCLVEDIRAMRVLTERLGMFHELPGAVEGVNLGRVQKIADMLDSPGFVAILGMSYKTGTDVVEGSPSVLLAKMLADDGVNVSVYDPMALDNVRKELGDSVQYAASVERAIAASQVVVVMHVYPEFVHLGRFVRPDQIVIDVWRGLNEAIIKDAGATYIPFGIGR